MQLELHQNSPAVLLSYKMLSVCLSVFNLTVFLPQINGLIVATLNHEQMIDMLRKPGSVMAVIVPPLPNGKPRK